MVITYWLLCVNSVDVHGILCFLRCENEEGQPGWVAGGWFTELKT